MNESLNYMNFYGMQKRPFQRDIPVDAVFWNDSFENAAGCIEMAVESNEFGILFGEPGVGKSLVVRKLLNTLPSGRYVSLYLTDSDMSPRWLYSGLLTKLGEPKKFYRHDGKRALQDIFLRLYEQEHKKIVVFLDEAHLLSYETLQEARFFLNMECDSRSIVALILIGQTELFSERLQGVHMTAIRDRVLYKAKLEPFDRADTGRYIRHQISYSGCDRDIFDEKAMDVIFASTGGNARRINKTCISCLLYGSQQKKNTLDNYAVSFVIEHQSLDC